VAYKGQVEQQAEPDSESRKTRQVYRIGAQLQHERQKQKWWKRLWHRQQHWSNIVPLLLSPSATKGLHRHEPNRDNRDNSFFEKLECIRFCVRRDWMMATERNVVATPSANPSMMSRIECHIEPHSRAVFHITNRSAARRRGISLITVREPLTDA
jgi:hypothetical protein